MTLLFLAIEVTNQKPRQLTTEATLSVTFGEALSDTLSNGAVFRKYLAMVGMVPPG